MPKYSVSEVLNIIKALTEEEKQELLQALPSVFDRLESTVLAGLPSLAQRQTMAGIRISRSSSVELSQNQADRGSDITQSKTQAMIQSADLQAALSLLAQLKRDVAASSALNSIEKKTIEVPIQTIEVELKQHKPDKSLIDQAIEALKKGLAGVEVLAAPVIRLADLIAKAWMPL
jgi:hypothetical protein